MCSIRPLPRRSARLQLQDCSPSRIDIHQGYHAERQSGRREHCRTQFDECIEFLIEAILVYNEEIDKLYIPLLFLIRHSLELALKRNIIEVQKISNLINSKDYSTEHSLATLYNCYLDFLNKIEDQCTCHIRWDSTPTRSFSDTQWIIKAKHIKSL